LHRVGLVLWGTRFLSEGSKDEGHVSSRLLYRD